MRVKTTDESAVVLLPKTSAGLAAATVNVLVLRVAAVVHTKKLPEESFPICPEPILITPVPPVNVPV